MDIQSGYVTSIFLLIFALFISSFGVTVIGDNVKCMESEGHALLSFKHGLQDLHGKLSSWKYENVEDCCNWRGVKCSNLTGHIIKLDLRSNDFLESLSGNIGPSILQLSYLSYLDLSYNGFEGSIPNYIGSLVNLKYLNLSHNWFSGIIPQHIGNLSSLHTLDLYGLSEVKNSKSLEWLSHLSSLQYLDLSIVNLENASDWLQVVNKLPLLQTLILSACELPPPILPSYDPYIKISTSLSKLDLSFNHLTSSIFLWLSNFNTSLVYLDLSVNNLQGYIPNAFGNLTSLSYIDFHNNQLEGASLKSYWNFCNLHSLDFSINKIKGTFFNFTQTWPRCLLNSLQDLNFFSNKFSGSLPDFSKFLNLRRLDLSTNEFSGKIPISLGQLSNLETLSLDHNSLEGTIFETHFLKLTKLRLMDLSHNSLNFHLPSNWIPPFQLDSIYLSSCTLGPKFPHWLQGQKFSNLDISNTSISEMIPRWFWNFSPNLEAFDLSDNKIRGKIPNLSTRFRGTERINLRSNEFEGQIPLFLSHAKLLSISNNKFSGLNFLCKINFVSPLYFLDVSNNQFWGELPDCWKNWSNLEYLSLANNGFSGGIPSSFRYLSELCSLHLSNNSFSGEFLSWLKNFNDLEVLNLGANNLTGTIPLWIGNELSKLVRLSLRSNQFYGELPSTLCHLNDILFLDLSINHITGAIPNCLNNLTALNNNISFDKVYSHTSFSLMTDNSHSYSNEDKNSEVLMTWKGREFNMKGDLFWLQSIDFSRNHLTGNIPNEITTLDGLVSLNLSRNNLIGKIPVKIGQLKSLDFLDLSRNELVGEIPVSLSQISTLSVLDLSYNKLSGKIPIGTQLQSFNDSSYVGNLGLCGSPLPKCREEEMVPNSPDKKYEANKNEFTSQGFYISIVVGFVVGFWGICASLIFLRSWRHVYFEFLSFLSDWFYVKIKIYMNKMGKLFKD